jgi:hypothetical protein
MPQPNFNNTKRCILCDTVKPFAEMKPHKQCRDGISTHCKACYNARWGTGEYNSRKCAKYRSRHLDKKKASDKAWYQRNKEHVAQRQQADHLRDPTRRQIAARNNKSRRKGAEGSHTKADIEILWKKQNGKCAVPTCSYPISESGEYRYHVDHIKPIRLGGSNNADNLQILCATHNLEKHGKDEYRWAQETLGVLFIAS